MIPSLCGVVENAATASQDQLFQRLALFRLARSQVVQIGKIGSVVLAVVEFDLLYGKVGSKCVFGIGQGGLSESPKILESASGCEGKRAVFGLGDAAGRLRSATGINATGE